MAREKRCFRHRASSFRKYLLAEGTAEPDTPKPASEVTADPAAEPAPVPAVPPKRSPSASACEPYREMIELPSPAGATPWPSGKTWFRSRLHQRLLGVGAISGKRLSAGCGEPAAGSSPGDRDGARGRGAGGLRHRPHGP